MPRFTIAEQHKNTRLDKFLVEQIPDKSRSQIQKMVKSGLVLVNGKKPTPHHFLKIGNEVEIKEIAEEIDSLRQEQGGPSALPIIGIKMIGGKEYSFTKKSIAATRLFPKQLEPKIIFEDENFLVINKPTGILIHARNENLLDQEPTIVDWAIKKYPDIKKVGDNLVLRPGIAHRLDKDASGIMVMAKTNAAFAHLKEQFKNREIKKEYLAWVHGKLAKNWDTITFPIGRSREEGKMAARPISASAETEQPGKEAITEYEVLKEFPHRSFVKVMPKTGRTHQIRVHFFAINHPLIGDKLYKSKSFKEIPAKRMMLHAHKLTFKDLTGVEHTYAAPLPKEFKDFENI